MPFLLLVLLSLFACQREPSTTVVSDPDVFDSIPKVTTVNPIVNEVSGIADSRTAPGHLWAQEDGGNPSDLILINHNGKVEKRVALTGISNRDWEDMALVNGQVYLGEIGDNNDVYPEYAIYKFAEPTATTDAVNSIETIRFRYSDGSHDAEALLVDPANGAIYLFTKRENPSRIFKLTPPFAAGVNTAQPVGSLPYGGVVSAALSPDRRAIILKTYFALQHYTVAASETFEAALGKAGKAIPYTAEPQGEAVCFSASGNGYFTLSEKGFSNTVQLYFYKRR